MIKKLIILSVSIVSIMPFSYAQEKKQKQADKLYEKSAYVDAIKIYERIASKGYVNQDILQNLGDSYYFNADYTNSYKWYKQLFENAEKDSENYNIGADYYYRYAQTLKSVEKYDEANEMLKKFIQLSEPSNKIARKLDNNINYLDQIRDNSDRLEISPVSVNTEYSEYATAYYDDKTVVITASRKPTVFKSASHWTGDSYYDLYATSLDSTGNISNETNFSSVLNSTLNESTPIFSKDKKTIYFTRNYNVPITEKDAKGNKDYKVLLELYKANNEDGVWSTPVKLPINKQGFSLAHPALSPDGKYLYFAADLPGSYGKSDLYRVSISDKGAFGKPENLGEKINTEGRETFPFITDNNILFFASDGLPGLGGLDIFAVKINEDGSLGKLQNIGRPANSPDDDFAFVFDIKTKQGFLSSNRLGGVGKDDIYKFVERKPLKFDDSPESEEVDSEGVVGGCKKAFKGIIKDIDTKEILTDTQVALFSKNLNEIGNLTNDENGEFDFGQKSVGCDDEFVYVRARKTDYSVAEQRVDIKDLENVYAEIFLKSVRKEFKVGDDMSKFFNIEIIYFDFDKSNIRYDAAVDLAKIVEVMKEHPNMKIEIQSHTDSRGSDSYNLALSNRRAKSTLEWMVANGIARNRLKAKGYGETQLVNDCSNGVPCSEEEHQLNRRSAFIITEM